MMPDMKDSIANVTTLLGTGSAMIGFNEILTFVLISTGIVLNVVRIRATNQRVKQESKK